jgi:2-keto-4-pentenoate hydratase/2-oxohepta-3-ene-1,7-dioic acid hydratase in catechol pathway
MRLARFGEPGSERPAVIAGHEAYDLSGVVSDIDGWAVSPGGLETIRSCLNELPRLDISGLRVGASIAKPGTIYCIGLNYADHAAESNAELPTEPVVFLKPSNTIVGPFDAVAIPRHCTKTDWEVEIGIVIGAPSLYLDDIDQATRAIAGYVTVNDFSERELQLERSGGQWSKGKAAPGFTPVGPTFVSSDEVDVRALRLRSWVNGELRQDSSSAELIFDPARIVYELSQFAQLDPGDLILSGTPAGVALSGRYPYLQAGDVVEVEVENLGRQRAAMVSS